MWDTSVWSADFNTTVSFSPGACRGGLLERLPTPGNDRVEGLRLYGRLMCVRRGQAWRKAEGRSAGDRGQSGGSDSERIEPKECVSCVWSTAVSTYAHRFQSTVPPPSALSFHPPLGSLILLSRLQPLSPSLSSYRLPPLFFRSRMSSSSQLAAKNKRRNATLSCAECRRYALSEFRAPRNIYPTGHFSTSPASN